MLGCHLNLGHKFKRSNEDALAMSDGSTGCSETDNELGRELINQD